MWNECTTDMNLPNPSLVQFIAYRINGFTASRTYPQSSPAGWELHCYLLSQLPPVQLYWTCNLQFRATSFSITSTLAASSPAELLAWAIQVISLGTDYCFCLYFGYNVHRFEVIYLYWDFPPKFYFYGVCFCRKWGFSKLHVLHCSRNTFSMLLEVFFISVFTYWNTNVQK